ncbi:MAG: heme ABC exporter ATP-binding protein CcmA [Planctomycetota bacterium]
MSDVPLSEPAPGAAALAIAVSGVRRYFGAYEVLAGIDLEVRNGEFVTLLGRNGAGKTTLLNIIGGLLKPNEGEVFVAGLDAKSQGAKIRPRLGWLSHQPGFYGDLTAHENLAFFARLYDLKDWRAAVERGLEQVGLADRRSDRVRTFSRGMLQRLAIARILVHEPSILLLDEPHTGLDLPAIELLNTLLEQFRGDRTILMTTHDLGLGSSLADRVIVLAEGRIVQELDGGQELSALREQYLAILSQEVAR